MDMQTACRLQAEEHAKGEQQNFQTTNRAEIDNMSKQTQATH